MAEFSHEYELLLAAISSNSTATTSLASTVNEVARNLAEKYITRDEDDRSDQRVKDELYMYVREQNSNIRQEGEEVHKGLQEQVKLCFVIIGVQMAALITMGGWLVVTK